MQGLWPPLGRFASLHLLRYKARRPTVASHGPVRSFGLPYVYLLVPVALRRAFDFSHAH